MNPTLPQKIEGLLLGTAVADAIGLPSEGMTPAKIQQLGWARNLKHRFYFGKGMWSDDTKQTIMLAQTLLHAKGDLQSLKARPGRGISGYVYQTVPCVILAGIRNHWEFRNTITELIAAGGDTDTTAAIAGALCDAFGGVPGIPSDWIDSLNEWPTPVSKMAQLSSALLEKQKSGFAPGGLHSYSFAISNSSPSFWSTGSPASSQPPFWLLERNN